MTLFGKPFIWSQAKSVGNFIEICREIFKIDFYVHFDKATI